MREILAKRLKECRKEKGYTQYQVAIYSDITEKAYQNYELMTREPNTNTYLNTRYLVGIIYSTLRPSP